MGALIRIGTAFDGRNKMGGRTEYSGILLHDVQINKTNDTPFAQNLVSGLWCFSLFVQESFYDIYQHDINYDTRYCSTIVLIA
jgi:hypothetical protein